MMIGSDIVKPADARPSGKPGECFYCQMPISALHKPDCVIVSKSVVVKITMEVVIDVPRDWGASNVNFKLNKSSWCASNIIEDLHDWKERSDTEGERRVMEQGFFGSMAQCLCQTFEGEFVRDATKEDHHALPVLIDPKNI